MELECVASNLYSWAEMVYCDNGVVVSGQESDRFLGRFFTSILTEHFQM